jgi:hypothetical protein
MSEGLLGELSWRYQKAGSQIWDNVSNRTLEFYPAGYTQKFIRKVTGKDYAEQVNRQEFFERLWKQADVLGKTDDTFPFKHFDYEIKFVPEPGNKFDKFAIKIIFSTPQENIDYWNEYCIGYVPARINQILLQNRERTSDVAIHSVTNNLNDKFYCARIAVGYDGKELVKSAHSDMKRFHNLVE